MSRFKVGDLVRVREWDDMVEEYGVDKDGDILTPFAFTQCMKKLCGKSAVVTRVTYLQKYSTYVIELAKHEDENEDDWMWNFSQEMFEYIGGEEFSNQDYLAVLDSAI